MTTAADIKSVQAMLNHLGANPSLAVDGVIGPMTEAAVAAFQVAHAISPADGTITPQTILALGIGAPSQIPPPGVIPNAPAKPAAVVPAAKSPFSITKITLGLTALGVAFLAWREATKS